MPRPTSSPAIGSRWPRPAGRSGSISSTGSRSSSNGAASSFRRSGAPWRARSRPAGSRSTWAPCAFVVNGADIMRPGIVALTDDIRADRPALVVEERHGKPLAVCIARLDADALRAETGGKVCKNIHHVGDEIWGLEV